MCRNDEGVCDNVLDVPAGQWIPACAGMTNRGDGAMCGNDVCVSTLQNYKSLALYHRCGFSRHTKF